MTSSREGAASGAVLCLIVALTRTGCGRIGAQSAADHEAASFADHVLLRVLNEASESGRARPTTKRRGTGAHVAQLTVPHRQSGYKLGSQPGRLYRGLRHRLRRLGRQVLCVGPGDGDCLPRGQGGRVRHRPCHRVPQTPRRPRAPAPSVRNGALRWMNEDSPNGAGPPASSAETRMPRPPYSSTCSTPSRPLTGGPPIVGRARWHNASWCGQLLHGHANRALGVNRCMDQTGACNN